MVSSRPVFVALEYVVFVVIVIIMTPVIVSIIVGSTYSCDKSSKIEPDGKFTAPKLNKTNIIEFSFNKF